MELSNTNGHSTIVQNTTQSNIRATPPNAAAFTRYVRNMGYNIYRAIMDLVDNAIDAHANDIRIIVDHQDLQVSASKASLSKKDKFRPKFNKNSRIFIIDDGVGMDETILDQAVRFGSDMKHNTRTDLGKFGMGLKTASLSFGTKFIVLTRQEGQPLLKAVHDLNEIVRLNKFVTDFTPPNQDDIDYFNKHFKSDTKSGTILCICDLDQLEVKDVQSFNETLRGKGKLGRVYRYFLAAGKKITVNRTEVEAFDPTLWDDPKTEHFTNGWEEIIIQENGTASKSKLLYRASRYKAGGGPKTVPQGIIWVRNLREISAGIEDDIWVRDPNLTGFTVEIRFIGELLDDLFKIPIPKDRVTLDQRMKDILKEHVGSIARHVRDGAKKDQALKRSLESGLTEFLDSYVDDVKAAEKFLDIPTGSKKDGSNEEAGSTSKPTKPVKNPRGPYGPHKNEITGCRSVGWIYKFELIPMGEYGPVCDFKQDDYEGVFTCYGNRDHPFVARQITSGEEKCKTPAANILLALTLAESQLSEKFSDAWGEFEEKFAKNLKGLTNHVH